MKFLSRFILNQRDLAGLKKIGVPFVAVVATYFVCISALLQGVSDFGLKFIYFSGVSPTINVSLEFAFLTLISMLMSLQSVNSMKKQRIELTKNSLEMSFLTELALFLSDFFYVIFSFEFSFAVLVRMPFALFTIINVCVVIYICYSLKIDIFSTSKIYKEIKEDISMLKSYLSRPKFKIRKLNMDEV